MHPTKLEPELNNKALLAGLIPMREEGTKDSLARDIKRIEHSSNYGRSRASQEVLKAYSEVRGLLTDTYRSLDCDEQFYLVRNDVPHDLTLSTLDTALDKIENDNWGLQWCNCSVSAGEDLIGNLFYQRDKERGGVVDLELKAKESEQVEGGQPYFLTDDEQEHVANLDELDRRLGAIVRDNSPLTNFISRWWQQLIED